MTLFQHGWLARKAVAAGCGSANARHQPRARAEAGWKLGLTFRFAGEKSGQMDDASSRWLGTALNG
jgi:hypothetical protein